MIKNGFVFCLVMAFFLLTSCSKPSKEENPGEAPFARIAGKVYSVGDLLSFNNMRYYHPVRQMTGSFPGGRTAVTTFIETQLLYKEAAYCIKQVMNGLEWEWKEIYLPGQLYKAAIIEKNLGFTDKELYKYFEKHQNELNVEFALQGEDFTFNSVRGTIIKRLFSETYSVDDDFIAQFPGLSDDEIEERWFTSVAEDRNVFFRDLYYKKHFGKDAPENIRDLYGVGNLISEGDLEVVRGWIAPEEKTQITEDEILHYMLAWIVFAKEAKASGFIKGSSYKKLEQQFEHFEVVRYYVNNILEDKVVSSYHPVKESFVYALADQQGKATFTVDSVALAERMNSASELMKNAAVLEYIHALRMASKVSFLQPDYVDFLGEKPSQLFHEADSLATSQNTASAEKIYTDLKRWYLYSPEGKTAFLELAKIHADNKQYRDAIACYRNYILFAGDSAEWCKTYFMIAYLYGEHLDEYDLAAMNYRWILANRPDCDLADDAEFMYLHLGEPMTDVDELRAEAQRQGRE